MFFYRDSLSFSPFLGTDKDFYIVFNGVLLSRVACFVFLYYVALWRWLVIQHYALQLSAFVYIACVDPGC